MKRRRVVTGVSVLGVVLLGSIAYAQREEPAVPSASLESSANGAAASRPSLGVDILSDTQRVNFDPYMKTLVAALKTSWGAGRAQQADASSDALRSASIRVTVQADGSIIAMRIIKPSGNVPFDRAAWSSLVRSAPFQPFPQSFAAPRLDLEVHFTDRP